METWAWLAAYLLGFALLQVYLYLYFVRRKPATGTGGNAAAETSSTESTPDGSSSGPSETGTAIDSSEDLDSDVCIRCDACGTDNRNDRMFVFCRNCGGRLH